MSQPKAQQVYVYEQYVSSNRILKVKKEYKHLDEY